MKNAKNYKKKKKQGRVKLLCFTAGLWLCISTPPTHPSDGWVGGWVGVWF